MLVAAGIVGFFAFLGFCFWYGIRQGTKAGQLEAQNDTLKKGATTDAKVQEILASEPSDPAGVVEWLRGDGKQP